MSTDSSHSPRLEQSRAVAWRDHAKPVDCLNVPPATDAPNEQTKRSGKLQQSRAERNWQRGLALFYTFVCLSVCPTVCLSVRLSVCKLFVFMRLPRRKWHRGCHLRKHANKISVPPCNILCISQIRADLPTTSLAQSVCVCECVGV